MKYQDDYEHQTAAPVPAVDFVLLILFIAMMIFPAFISMRVFP